jgi:hypothetical protein
MLLLPPHYTDYPITLVDSEAPVTPLKGKGGLCYQASQESDEREVEQRGGQQGGGRGRYGPDFFPGISHHRDPSPSRGPINQHPRPGFAPSPRCQERVQQGTGIRRLDDGAVKGTMHPRGSSPALVSSMKKDTRLELPNYPMHHKQQDLHSDGVANRPKMQPGFTKRHVNSGAQKNANVVKTAALPPPIPVATKGYPDLEDGHREKPRKREELIPLK